MPRGTRAGLYTFPSEATGIWSSNHNALAGLMQIGCGVYEHVVRGRPYLYFWHYESSKGRRQQLKEYLGSSDSDAVRADAIRRVDAYFRKAATELQRLRKQILADLARGR